MSACKTVRIKPTEQIQCPGHDFVEINESDFDESIHELYEEGGHVKSMTVAEIREALSLNGIDIPDGVTKKADLFELLTGQ